MPAGRSLCPAGGAAARSRVRRMKAALRIQAPRRSSTLGRCRTTPTLSRLRTAACCCRYGTGQDARVCPRARSGTNCMPDSGLRRLAGTCLTSVLLETLRNRLSVLLMSMTEAHAPSRRPTTDTYTGRFHWRPSHCGTCSSSGSPCVLSSFPRTGIGVKAQVPDVCTVPPKECRAVKTLPG